MKQVPNDDGPSRSTPPHSTVDGGSYAGDVFSEAFRRVVETEVRKALSSNETSNPRLMTVKQAADYLALSVREIYNMIASHDLPPVKRGRRTMLDIQDLDNWIDRNKG